MLLYQAQTVTPARWLYRETCEDRLLPNLIFLSTMAAVRQALAAKRRLAQLVEHLSYTQQATGSIPVSPSCRERIINKLTVVSTSARKHLETGDFLIQEGK